MTGAAVPTAGVAGHSKSRKTATAAVTLIGVRRIGYILLALQLIGFLGWSALLYRRFALTIDFAQYQQAWYLIAHGHLDPVNTAGNGHFWQVHSELIMWPLALAYWLWPHPVTLLWLQDAAVTGAEAVAFTWICEIARRHGTGRTGAALAATGLLLLVINPWIWWSVSFDFHTESMAVLFACLLARDLANGRRRAWAWAALLMACGDVADTYLVGFGVAVMLADRRFRWRGAALSACGLAAAGIITIVHGNLGSPLNGYAALVGTAAQQATKPPGLITLVKGVASHPLALLRAIWSKRIDVWANLGSAGVLGIAFVRTLPVIAIVLVANTLFPGLTFAMPSFQDLAVYLLLPVGTVAILAALARRHRLAGLTLAGLVVVQAAGIGAAWWPQLPAHWLRVPAATAATLSAVEGRIPDSADVVASEGIAGRFSGRVNIHAVEGPGPVPASGQTWFVIAPTAGLEVQTTASAMAWVADLAGPVHASLITHANGVWAFRWQAPPGVRDLAVPGQPEALPAWTSPGAAGRDVLTGPVAGWHVTSTGAQGYVTDGLQWIERPGDYQATVTLAATGPVNVEVWNDNCGTLLARRTLPASAGVQSVPMSVDASVACRVPDYSGWGPFRADFLPPPAGQRLEIRVWSPGSETVNVYRAGLTAAR